MVIGGMVYDCFTALPIFSHIKPMNHYPRSIIGLMWVKYGKWYQYVTIIQLPTLNQCWVRHHTQDTVNSSDRSVLS